MKGVPISRERARFMGMWVMERFTVCRECDRYTHTTRERICQRCWKAAWGVVSFLCR